MEELPAYKAFVSYCHSSPDDYWAKWLHRKLVSYRPPGGLVRNGRVGRIFRDREELPAGAPLSERLKEVLSSSEYLIVICSPKTPESPWVAKEVDWFCDTGKSKSTIPVLVSGNLTDSSPKRLQEEWAAAELLAANFTNKRGIQNYLDRRLELARVAAPLLGCNLNDLLNREKNRIRRRRNVSVGLLILLVILFASLYAYANAQRIKAINAQLFADQKSIEAVKSKNEAVRAEIAAERQLALTVAENGDLPRALALYIHTAQREEIISDNTTTALRFLAQKTMNLKQAAPSRRPTILSWRGKTYLLNDAGRFVPIFIHASTYSVNKRLGVILVLDVDGSIHVIDQSTGEVLWHLEEVDLSKGTFDWINNPEMLRTYSFRDAQPQPYGFLLEGVLDLPPILTQTVKTQNPFKGELSHGVVA